MKSVVTIIAFYVSFAYAMNFQVTVGAEGLVYNPNTVVANPGDTIEFLVTGVNSST
jgi:plastocyanin